jgi:hypothetical protein
MRYAWFLTVHQNTARVSIHAGAAHCHRAVWCFRGERPGKMHMVSSAPHLKREDLRLPQGLHELI